MISARILVVSMSWAVLSAASLICAEDAKPAEAKLMLQRSPVIQELALQPPSLLAFSLPAGPVSAPWIDTPDLSRYREFQF